MGGHVFLEYKSFRMTCLMRAYVLREVMLCRRKCLVGGHEDTLYEERFYWRVCLIGSHVLQGGISFTGGNVLQGYMQYEWTCIVELHELM